MPRPLLALLCLIAIAAACAADHEPERVSSEAVAAEPAEPEPVEPAVAVAPPVESDQPPADAALAVTGRGGYRVAYRPLAGSIARGEPFALDVWVLDANGERLARDVELAADAAMPEHEHGMNRVPRVSASGDGRFRVDGLLFHMAGRWELYLDVTRGPLTERARFEVTLE